MAQVLLAEDNGGFASAISFNLEFAGHKVIIACDGQAAWECAQRERFDLVILDYAMPRMTGPDLCRHLRQDARYAQMPIILMTARRDVDIPKLTDELSLSAFFHKPFSTSKMLDKVKELLDKLPA